MNRQRIVQHASTAAVVGVLVIGGFLISSPRAHADESDDEAAIGLRIAPVQLNMRGKDPRLVGLGSFIVNAQADCNGCHVSAPPLEYLDPGNPFFNQAPKHINPATYLAGGQDFGAVGPGNGGTAPGTGPDIISRNLTPDHTGLPEGGHTFAQFLTIMRTGTDFDHLHPNCSSKVTTNCYQSVPGDQVDGALLQVMPWPNMGNMTDYQLLAIYTYLSAVPCNANSSSPYPWVRNVC